MVLTALAGMYISVCLSVFHRNSVATVHELVTKL